MTIEIECDCGKQLRVNDSYAGRKAKCPGCGETIHIPSLTEPATSEIPPLPNQPAATNPYTAAPSGGRIAGVSTRSISGPSATSFGTTGFALSPVAFSNTMLMLEDDRVIEETKRPIARRSSLILLTAIDSAEIVHTGNPILLVLGLIALPLFGLGLIFIILYFFAKNRFLIIRSYANAQIVVIKGHEKPYREFMRSVISAAKDAKHAQ